MKVDPNELQMFGHRKKEPIQLSYSPMMPGGMLVEEDSLWTAYISVVLHQ